MHVLLVYYLDFGRWTSSVTSIFGIHWLSESVVIVRYWDFDFFYTWLFLAMMKSLSENSQQQAIRTVECRFCLLLFSLKYAHLHSHMLLFLWWKWRLPRLIPFSCAVTFQHWCRLRSGKVFLTEVFFAHINSCHFNWCMCLLNHGLDSIFWQKTPRNVYTVQLLPHNREAFQAICFLCLS